MPSYTNDDLDDLEEAARDPEPDNQAVALELVSRILEENSVTYAVMGGMNFFIRGSARTTQDVDIAVNNRPRMDALLSCFDAHLSIYRPRNRMQWLSGTARIFVRVQSQFVQFDLMPKGAEGPSIPSDLAGSVERLMVSTLSGSFECNFMAIGPLVKAKIKAFYNREAVTDYIDLCFVCKSSIYGQAVRAAAGNLRREWKDAFLAEVRSRNYADEQQVRWALRMEQTSSSGNNRGASSYGSGGSDRGSGSSSGPRDGEMSADGYWTYSARHVDWYHRHSDGSYSWASNSSSSSSSRR